MPRLTPKAQTTATCHSPAWAPVATAALTAPMPKNTRMKVPMNSPASAGQKRSRRLDSLAARVLARFADTLDQNAHAVMMLNGAAWHDARALTVPDNVTLALLPPYSPELNPVERVWLYLRERFLSLRVLDDTEAIIDACCKAWIKLIEEPERMRSLCAYPRDERRELPAQAEQNQKQILSRPATKTGAPSA